MGAASNAYIGFKWDLYNHRITGSQENLCDGGAHKLLNTETKACLEAAGDSRDTKAGIYL